jgi:membrane fusion protein (multidrug efflux system)
MMNKNLNLILAALILEGITISCNHSDPKGIGKDPLSVNVYIVKNENVVFYDSYPGTIIALNQVELRGQVSGYVTKIFFTEGQFVKKGQKLYEIDRSMYEANYQQANANYEIANDNLNKADQDARRYKELSDQDAISKQRLDYALTDLQNAKLQVESAKAEMLKAQNNLDYSLITAPFDGIIVISQVKIGNLITPSQTLLNTISSDNPMGVDFEIDEKNLSRFELLEKKNVTDKDSTYRIQLPDNTVYPFTGTLSVIDRAVDPQTGTITVRIVFPNPTGGLRTGMSCNLKVMNQNAGLQVVIPYKSVSEQMGEYFVYRADSSVVHQARIKLGPRIEDKVVVFDGLKPGNKIVVEGIQQLHEGMPIQIAAPQKSNNPSGSYKTRS